MDEPIRLYQSDNNSEQPPQIEMCSICLENLNSDNPVHELTECKHKFHSSCLISWLRFNKECPMCRGLSDKKPVGYRSEGTILKHILAFCRSKKNKSPKLKRLYLKYVKLRDNYNLKNKERKEFEKQHRDIFRKKGKLNNQFWYARNKFSRIKREIRTLPLEFINRQ
jgi:hypothetical protein